MHITFSATMGASRTWFDLMGKKILSLSPISSGMAEKNVALVRSKDTQERGRGGGWGGVIDAAGGSISQPARAEERQRLFRVAGSDLVESREGLQEDEVMNEGSVEGMKG